MCWMLFYNAKPSVVCFVFRLESRRSKRNSVGSDIYLIFYVSNDILLRQDDKRGSVGLFYCSGLRDLKMWGSGRCCGLLYSILYELLGEFSYFRCVLSVGHLASFLCPEML